MSPLSRRVHRPALLQQTNSIKSVLSMVFEHLMSVRLRRFMERRAELPTTQIAYLKGMGCDALVYLSHTLQSALESG